MRKRLKKKALLRQQAKAWQDVVSGTSGNRPGDWELARLPAWIPGKSRHIGRHKALRMVRKRKREITEAFLAANPVYDYVRVIQWTKKA